MSNILKTDNEFSHVMKKMTLMHIIYTKLQASGAHTISHYRWGSLIIDMTKVEPCGLQKRTKSSNMWLTHLFVCRNVQEISVAKFTTEH